MHDEESAIDVHDNKDDVQEDQEEDESASSFSSKISTIATVSNASNPPSCLSDVCSTSYKSWCNHIKRTWVKRNVNLFGYLEKS